MWSPPLLLVAPADSLAFRSTQKGPVLRKPGTPVVLESWTGRLGSYGVSCMCPVVRLSLD